MENQTDFKRFRAPHTSLTFILPDVSMTITVCDVQQSTSFCTLSTAVLQWAHTNGCPWDKWVCVFAATSGHYDVLQWAWTNGFPWDEQRVFQCIRNYHPESCNETCKNGPLLQRTLFRNVVHKHDQLFVCRIKKVHQCLAYDVRSENIQPT
jgi:hypothetical protein